MSEASRRQSIPVALKAVELVSHFPSLLRVRRSSLGSVCRTEDRIKQCPGTGLCIVAQQPRFTHMHEPFRCPSDSMPPPLAGRSQVGSFGTESADGVATRNHLLLEGLSKSLTATMVQHPVRCIRQSSHAAFQVESFRCVCPLRSEATFFHVCSRKLSVRR